MSKLMDFLKKVKVELKKVSWPDKKTVKSSTIAVVIVSLFFGVYIGVVDYVLKNIFQHIVLK
jgi:preprotein translocase subunit SecE